MLVVILVYRGFMTLGRGRLMRCGHAMRHSELETTVRAPAMIFKGCLFFFFFCRFSFWARCCGHHLWDCGKLLSVLDDSPHKKWGLCVQENKNLALTRAKKLFFFFFFLNLEICNNVEERKSKK